MGGKEWAISLVLGLVTLPLGTLICLIPNEPCECVFVMLWLLPKSEVQPTMLPDTKPGFAFAMNRMCDNLGTFSKLHSGHMCSSSFCLQELFSDHWS
jgi:Ca2+-transporting ATPase